MSLGGTDLLRALDEALRDIRREEDDISKRAARGAELLIKHRGQEAELYRQLGTLRPDPAARAAIATLVRDIDEAAEAALSRYDATFAETEAELQQVEANLARGNADRMSLQAEIGRRDAEIRALEAAARPRLGADANYAAKLERGRSLEAIGAQLRTKLMVAEADREQKGRPFRDDPLFMYLWTKGYGTESYRGRGLVATLDRRVAQLIAYDKAREAFVLLSEIPVRLRNLSTQVEADAAAARTEIARLENSALDSEGGKSVREAIETVVVRIETLDREVAALQDRRDATIATRTELALGREVAFSIATDDLDQVLAQDDLRQLLAEARSEAGGAAATIAQQIEDLRQRIKEDGDEMREHGLRLKVLAMRRRDLEDILHELKARGFDNPHARFASDELVGETLNALLRGEISAAQFWDLTRRMQSWTASGYGGPGGGWGKLPSPTGAGLSRQRPRTPPARGLTSAA
jgi:hypothetical protein